MLVSPVVIGEVIAGYRLVGRLGGSSTGDVYAAEHASVGTKAAIKIITPALAADPGRLQRYLRDAQAASRIANQGTVKISDVGMPAGYGHGFLVMELLEGETLARRIARTGRLSVTQIAELGRQIATVLAALHDDNLAHRDLRPETIFLARDAGPGERIKLLVGDTLLLGATHAKAAPYAAPELWRGEPGDWRGDVYALGCTMFEMATGRPPYRGDDVAAKHAEHAIPAARSLMPDVPPALDALIARLVAKHVDQRPKSLREVARELDSLGGTARPLASTQQERPVAVGEVIASPARTAEIASPPRSAEPSARKRLGIVVAIVLAIAVAIAVVLLAG